LPWGLRVNLAPRGPKDREPPDLLRFSVTPVATLILLQKRNPIGQFLHYALSFL
jgi:hypothetical protein